MLVSIFNWLCFQKSIFYYLNVYFIKSTIYYINRVTCS